MLSPTLVAQLILFHGLLAKADLSVLPGYIPLAVKTPYLHGWVANSGTESPAGQWPSFVSNDRLLGWIGMIRVDGQAYQWMGDNGINSTRTAMSKITPSKSIFRIEAGSVQFNVTFLSPIEPNDYVRQSIPFSYMCIDGIAVNDSQLHTVQVYSDISAEWVSRDDATLVEWSTTTTNDSIYHAVQQQNPSPMVENGGISEDATVYYATVKRPGVTWQTGLYSVTRSRFLTNGTLPNTMDTNFRSVSPDWPVFALSVDLGDIGPGTQPDPVVWAIGIVRDPLVMYSAGGFAQNRSAYFWLNYTSIKEVISAFLSDLPAALSRSSVLDNRILSAGTDPSLEYAPILSLVTRQIFASMDITIPSAQPGQFNNTDVKIFMKDIGQSRRSNPVEVIYGALPALIFFNPFLVRDLLQPLLEFQASSQYTNSYASPDLGTSYPVVGGNSADNQILAVENCGNMLIMVYAYAAKSGDGTLLSRYYSVLQRWADFLIENTLHPRGFMTADGLNNPDMSNLALKGILGIYFMAKINEAMGVSNTTYMDQALQLIKDWKQLAIAADGHIQAVYGQTSSWGLMYNIFPAVWLKTGLIEDIILQNQAQFYAQQKYFSLILDTSRPDTAYPHWTMMTAATIPDSLITIRDSLFVSTFTQAYWPNSTSPLPVAYNATNGKALSGSGSGSPILGASFAVVALQLQNIDISVPQSNSSSSPSSFPSSSRTKGNGSAIVGGVLGTLALLLVITAILIFWRRKHKPRQPKTDPFIATTYNNTDRGMAQVSHQTNVESKWFPGRLRSSEPLPISGARKTPISPPAQRGAAPLISRKQREGSDIPVQRNVPRLTPSNSDSTNVLETGDLREELEQLRREVESMRHIADVPPEYS